MALQTPDESWRAVDYQKQNQVVTSVLVIVPDMVIFTRED